MGIGCQAKKFQSQCVTTQHKVVVNGKLSHCAYSRKRALQRVDLGRLGRVGAEAGLWRVGVGLGLGIVRVQMEIRIGLSWVWVWN